MTGHGMSDASLHTALTSDGALTLAVDGTIADLVSAWLPAHVTLASRQTVAPIAAIRVRAVRELGTVAHAVAELAPSRRPDLVAGPIYLWRDGDRMLLREVDAHGAESARSAGLIDLARSSATIETAATERAETAPLIALHTMLLLASAYLLGRLGRALVHGASLVAPDGRAWLLVGDTHAGKTTTCATLVDAGWHYCADDHAILRLAPAGGVLVEGWPRLFHLDHGWDHGAPAGGPRCDVDAFVRWPGRWRPVAPLGGLLSSQVDADAATVLAPLVAPARLAALLRQSPWLTVDPTAAPALLALLQRVAAHPGAALHLGRDTFHRPGPLAAVLAPLTACA